MNGGTVARFPPEFLEGGLLTMEEYEKRILRKTIDTAGSNLTEEAKRLGISRVSVYNNK